MLPPALSVEAIQILEWIEDPRRKQAQRHSLVSIMAVVFCGLAMGEEGWDRMANMAKMCWAWFRTTLPCAEVAPSADTLRRVVSGMKPEAFKEYFKEWCKALKQGQSDLLHADGKKIRGSDDGYVVTLFSGRDCLSISQEAVGEGGEQAALERLIEALELKGTMVTLDAGFCTRDIAQKFIDAKAYYIMVAKKNQSELYSEIQELIERQMKAGHSHIPAVKLDESHGRCETRTAYILNDPTLIDLTNPFPGIQTVGWIDSEIYRSKEELEQGSPTFSRRFYVSSKKLTPQQLLDAVRLHWSIENKLHWVLDVVFKEDQCLVRTKATAENLSWMRKLLLNALKRLFPKSSMPQALQKVRYSESSQIGRAHV